MIKRNPILLAGWGPNDLIPRLIKANWVPGDRKLDEEEEGQYFDSIVLGGKRLCNVNPGSLAKSDPEFHADSYGEFDVMVEERHIVKPEEFVLRGYTRREIGMLIDIGLKKDASPNAKGGCKTTFCGATLVDYPAPASPVFYRVLVIGPIREVVNDTVL